MRFLVTGITGFVGTSWQAPAETFVTNALSQVNLLEAVRIVMEKLLGD